MGRGQGLEKLWTQDPLGPLPSPASNGAALQGVGAEWGANVSCPSDRLPWVSPTQPGPLPASFIFKIKVSALATGLVSGGKSNKWPHAGD